MNPAHAEAGRNIKIAVVNELAWYSVKFRD
jgi:hypothetical protein